MGEPTLRRSAPDRRNQWHLGYTSDVDISIRRNDAAGRYELLLDGELASFTEFQDQDGAQGLTYFPHTVTLPQYRNQGLAARVVRYALDDTRARGRSVVPLCWFVAQFIDDHPEYQALLAA